MSRPGSILKFERAHKHLQEAETDAAKFLARKPYEVVPDTDAYPSKLSYFLTLLEPPPDSISLALGDAIHNCRTALDHAVYEVSEKRETDPRDTAFPFCTMEPLPVLNIAFTEGGPVSEPAIAKVERLIGGAGWVLNNLLAQA